MNYFDIFVPHDTVKFSLTNQIIYSTLKHQVTCGKDVFYISSEYSVEVGKLKVWPVRINTITLVQPKFQIGLDAVGQTSLTT